MFLDVAVAAENLHGVVGHFQALLGEEALQDRRQEAQLAVPAIVFFLIVFQHPGDHVVRVLGGEVDHRPAALGDRFLLEQHAAHVTVVDQGVGHRVRVFLAGQGAHGTAFLGVGQ